MMLVFVAEHLYGTHETFVKVMNDKAQELGLKTLTLSMPMAYLPKNIILVPTMWRK